MVKIKYIGTGGLSIPRLKSRPMGVNFPMMDYRAGVPMEDQSIEVDEKEANDLIRQGHFVAVIEKKSRKKESEE